MANLDRAFGFRFVGMLTGAAANVSMRRYRLPAAETDAVFVGDPVIRLTSSSILSSGTTISLNQDAGLEYVQRATGADAENIIGIVAGFAYNPASLTSNYSVGTAERDVFVIDDPNALFEVQSDVTGIAYTALGMNVTATMTAGSTVTGISKAVVTTATADASKPFLIVGWSKDPKNDIASAAYVKVIVKINNHSLGWNTATGALGV
jgi:hypothetical protein